MAKTDADLKLIAFDADDLNVMSAHLQDAVMRVADMAYIPKEKRFAALINRFDWSKAQEPEAALTSRPSLLSPKSPYQRRRAGLRFERVLSAQVHKIDLTDDKAALALLAVTFESAPDKETPGGDVTLTFSGGAAIRLSVECLEVEMRDLGAAWGTNTVPTHSDTET